MQTIIFLLVLVAIGWLAYNRGRIIDSVPALRAVVTSLVASRTASQSGELAPLIAALYNSVIDKSRRTWWTRTHHIEVTEWTIHASPEDAEVLVHCVPAVEADLNAALRDNAARHRIVVGAPVRVRDVVADSQVATGRPYLGPAGEARAPRASGSAVQTGRPTRTNFGAKWEAPTSLAKTIAETFANAPATVRLWPIGAESDRDPIEVPADGLVLGRSPQLSLGRIMSRTVSERHAELRCIGDRWVLRDLGSRNGTFLGARRVREAEVRSGDIIGLGRHVRLRMVVGEQASEETMPAIA